MVCLIALFCLTGSLSQAAKTPKTVLVIFSGVGYITDKSGQKHDAGYLLQEFTTPYKIFKEKGFDVELATPDGQVPKVDPQSLAVDASGKARFWPSQAAFEEGAKIMNTVVNKGKIKSLATIKDQDLAKYSAVFFPGGHAPTEDLAVNADVSRILKYFHGKGKTTALICHGPAALLSTDKNGGFLYKGYKLTSYSNSEESRTPLSKFLRFTPETALSQAGAVFSKGQDWTSYVVEDRELITGQNPASSEAVANAIVKKLSH